MPTYKEIMEGRSRERRQFKAFAKAFDKNPSSSETGKSLADYEREKKKNEASRMLRGGANKRTMNLRFNKGSSIAGNVAKTRFSAAADKKRYLAVGEETINEGIRRAVRLMNKVYKKGKPVTDDTTKTKAYADFIGMQSRHAAKQARRGGASPEEIKGKTSADIEKKIKGMKRFQDTATVKRQEAGYKGKMK